MEKAEQIDQELERVATSIGIPPCPAILIDLAAEIRNDDPDFAKIEHLVAKDVGLSASLLKTINSPFYALRNKVENVKQAISMLGLNTLNRTVTGLVLRNSFASKDLVSMERFWDTSAQIAMSASYLAKNLPGMNRDDAYTFGLFQNCGIPVLMQRFPDYKETLAVANTCEDKSFTQVEDAAHGTDHATIGYVLTKSWHLPETLSTAIRFHHEYQMLGEDNPDVSAESRKLIAVGLMADHVVALQSGQNSSLEWFKGGDLALMYLGLSRTEFEELNQDVLALLDDED